MGVLVKNGKSYTGTGDLLIQPVIYSDDERCIGVWRDGKPLYQKTISFDDTMFQTDGSGKKITVTIPDVESVKTSQVFIENNVLPLTYSQDSMYVTYWAIVNDTDTVDIVFRYSSEIGSNLHGFFIGSTAILQYTKTTDTAGTAAWVPTGATPIHYSLNEQVIGTWIDGKPLYQKVVEFTITNSNTWTDYNHGISGIEKCVSMDCFAVYNDEIYTVGPKHNESFISGFFGKTSVSVSSKNYSNYTARCILRYTKTT